MIDAILLDLFRQSGDVCFSQYTSPTGEIYILGNDFSVKALIFKSSYPGTPPINRYFPKRGGVCIDAAIAFLDDYFNTSTVKQKTGIAGTVVKSDGEGKLLIVTLNRITLPLDLSHFTVKEIAIYRELSGIPAGATISYGLLAERAGIPGGARFAGNAMAKNNFPIIIPCHRVIKSDGSIGNYSGGIHIKNCLLEYEKEVFK